MALRLGGLQQALDLGGDLRLQMALQDLALLGRQQLVALGDLLAEVERDPVGTLAPPLVEDVDDEAQVARLDVRLVAARVERPLQVGGVAGDLLLHALPCRVVVLDVSERLLGAARQRQGRVDGPAAGEIRHGASGQAASSSPVAAKRWKRATESARSMLRCSKVAAAMLRIGSGDGARLAALVQRGVRLFEPRFAAGDIGFRLRQLAPQVLDLGPNGPTQDGQARVRLIRLDQRGGRAFLAVPKVVVRLLLDPALAL